MKYKKIISYKSEINFKVNWYNENEYIDKYYASCEKLVYNNYNFFCLYNNKIYKKDYHIHSKKYYLDYYNDLSFSENNIYLKNSTNTKIIYNNLQTNEFLIGPNFNSTNVKEFSKYFIIEDKFIYLNNLGKKNSKDLIKKFKKIKISLDKNNIIAIDENNKLNLYDNNLKNILNLNPYFNFNEIVDFNGFYFISNLKKTYNIYSVKKINKKYKKILISSINLKYYYSAIIKNYLIISNYYFKIDDKNIKKILFNKNDNIKNIKKINLNFIEIIDNSKNKFLYKFESNKIKEFKSKYLLMDYILFKDNKNFNYSYIIKYNDIKNKKNEIEILDYEDDEYVIKKFDFKDKLVHFQIISNIIYLIIKNNNNKKLYCNLIEYNYFENNYLRFRIKNKQNIHEYKKVIYLENYVVYDNKLVYKKNVSVSFDKNKMFNLKYKYDDFLNNWGKFHFKKKIKHKKKDVVNEITKKFKERLHKLTEWNEKLKNKSKIYLIFMIIIGGFLLLFLILFIKVMITKKKTNNN